MEEEDDTMFVSFSRLYYLLNVVAVYQAVICVCLKQDQYYQTLLLVDITIIIPSHQHHHNSAFPRLNTSLTYE